MQHRFLIFLFAALFLFGGISSAQAKNSEKKEKDLDPETCARLAVPAPPPAPVDLDVLFRQMKELKTDNGKILIDFSEEFEAETRKVFDTNVVKTKMEQFYRLLHVVAGHMNPELPRVVNVHPEMVREVLLTVKVFYDPMIPNQIMGVEIDRRREEDPRYTVEFKDDATQMPLNQGNGFYAYTHDLCQQTTHLFFYKKFSFSLRVRPKGNIIARYFKGVDFFGKFGTRGMFDIDFEYVALKSVEFYQGQKDGKVTAAISEMEFKKNEHNALLRIITKFVKNSSIQPLGW